MNSGQSNHGQLRQALRHQAAQIKQEECEWITRSQHKDRDAFQHLILRYQDDVYSYIIHLVSDSKQALNMTRDVFVAAYRSLSGYSPENSFKSWLLTLAEQQIRKASSPRQNRLIALLSRWFASPSSDDAPDTSGGTPDANTPCQQIQSLLSPYLDGEVSTSEAWQVEAHLQQCAACRREYDALRESVNLTHTFGLHSAPPELRFQINAVLDVLTTPVWTRLAGWFSISSAQATAMAAWLIVFLLGGIVVMQIRQVQRWEQPSFTQIRSFPERGTAERQASQFVVVAGSVAEELPADVLDLIFNTLHAHPDTTDVTFASEDIAQILPALEQQIAAMHGSLRLREVVPHPTFTIQHLLVEVPASSGVIISTFFRQFTPAPQASAPAISKTVLEIYLIEQS